MSNDTKKDTKVVGVKDLAKVTGMKEKVIRRHLRNMEESSKPADGTKYQWRSTSPEYKAVLEALKEHRKKQGIIR